MKKNQLTSGLKKATIEMVLLRLLLEGDMYGYQITQEIKKRSNNMYTILEGSMYPILYRLTDQSMISSYNKKVGVRKTRVYYHLEQSGKEYYESLLNDYNSFTQMLDFIFDSKEGDIFNETK